MANNEFIIPIPGRIKNVAKGGHVAGAEDIIDDATGKTQKEINDATSQDIDEIKGGSTDSITTLDQKITTEKGRAQDAEQSLDNRLSSVEELASISIDGGTIGVGNDYLDIYQASAKVATMNALTSKFHQLSNHEIIGSYLRLDNVGEVYTVRERFGQNYFITPYIKTSASHIKWYYYAKSNSPIVLQVVDENFNNVASFNQVEGSERVLDVSNRTYVYVRASFQLQYKNQVYLADQDDNIIWNKTSKFEDLEIDDEPTPESDNPVKSGGVMKAFGVIVDSPYSFTGRGITYDYRNIGSFNVTGYNSIMVIIGNYEIPEEAQEYPFISIRQKDSNNQTIERDDVNKTVNYININENTIEIEIIVALSTTTVSDGVYKFDKISIYGTIKYDVESLKLKNKYATPEQYGAVCDGITDDTNAFQAALDSGSPVFAFGNSYKVREITLHYGNTLCCTNNITGTILLKGSRINLSLNRLHGRIIVGGNDTNGSISHNIIKFNLIYTPDGQDGITLDGSTYGVQNTLIYGGQITNYIASDEKTYMNGIHMISGNDVIEGYTSFCNQNIIFAVVAYNALNAGLFMDATATDDKKPAKMDGNIFFNFDAEQCTKGIIMGTYCIGNHFYGLRNNEFGVSDTLLEFGEGCEDNVFYLTKGFFPNNIKCAGPITSESFNTIYGGLLNLSFAHIWYNPTLFRGELDGKVSLVPQGVLPDKLINLQEDTVINYDTRNPNTIANGTIFEGEHTLTLNNSFGENKRTSIKVLAYANKKPTDIFVPKKKRSIVDLEINNKDYSFESHGTTYDYITIEETVIPTTVGYFYVNSGELKNPEGNQFTLYLRLLDRQNIEISKFLIISNNTLNFGIPEGVYRIQLQARLSTTSPSIEGTYTANMTIKGNVSEHIVPSETVVEENTLYDIQLTQANYYISKQTVNIGVLR